MPTSVPPISARPIRAAVLWLASLGLDVRSVLSSAGLDLAQFMEADFRMDADRVRKFWEAIAAVTAPLGHAHPGITAVDALPVALFQSPGRSTEYTGMDVLMNSATVAMAVRRYARFFPVVHHGGTVTVSDDATGLTLGWHLGEPSPGPHHEAFSVSIVHRALLAAIEVQPVEVRFTSPKPEDDAATRKVFGGAALVWGADAPQLVYAVEVLGLGPPGASDESEAALERQLEATLAEAFPASPDRLLAERVLHFVAKRLRSAEPVDADAVAQDVAMSRRTLVRQLAATGHTFRELSDQVLAARARELIEDGQSLEKVAEQLGYASDRSLRRAYRRWYGVTPILKRG